MLSALLEDLVCLQITVEVTKSLVDYIKTQPLVLAVFGREQKQPWLRSETLLICNPKIFS